MDTVLPVLFLGHGDPTNAIKDNGFTRSLRTLGESLVPRPRVILMVSAHWLTDGTWVCTAEKPGTIYDFGGFPEELYRLVYPAPGSPTAAERTARLDPAILLTDQWGLDHGAWTVLRHLVPKADIPVFQMSIDYRKPLAYHFALGKKLRVLRNEGVLIVGSGNIVHNLRMAFARGLDASAYEWALEFDSWVKDRMAARDYDSLVDFEKGGRAAQLSVPTVDHYAPLLYTLGSSEKTESIVFPYEEVFSSLSMRCARIG